MTGDIYTSCDTNSHVIYVNYYDSCTSTGGNIRINPQSSMVDVYTPPPPKRILVKLPKKWGKKRVMAFADLINVKTRTGWKVELVIHGGIEICDPSLEVRKLKRVVPLLLERASQEDKAIIQDFLES